MADLFKMISDTDEAALNGKFLTFLIDKETYGIEIRHVMEIIKIQTITRLPETPDYMKGIIILREGIIPVMDVTLRFKKPCKDYNDRTSIIVINFGEILVGLIVDTVSEVLTISSADVVVTPEINVKDSSGYIKSIGKVADQIILLIDCEKLLDKQSLAVASSKSD